MTKVAKFNTFKGISTAITFGTPLVTMAIVGDFFVTKPSAAISGAAVFALLLTALLAKDKILEKFKAPSALVIAVAVLIFCVVVENILYPIKIISLATLIACGIDEFTFKNLYKSIEAGLPQDAARLKRFGFYTTTQKRLDSLAAEVKE